jgi:hypothetical protein
MLIFRCRILPALVLSLLLACFFPQFASAQTATVKGIVRDSAGRPVEFASVGFYGTTKGGTRSDSAGGYSLTVPTGSVTITVIHTRYQYYSKKIIVKEGEVFLLDIILQTDTVYQREFIKYGIPKAGSIPPRDFKLSAGPNRDIKNILVMSGGVQSSNELSNQYNVRGGNFDENKVYVNGIEVFRPFLTRSGQQEGLSFVNVDMTESIYFSAGGFESRYGDAMSSVLDVKYRTPDSLRGTVSANLLGFSAEVEGMASSRFRYMIGFRNKSNRYLLHSLDTRGEYRANFTDVQLFATYLISDVWQMEYLGNYASNRYQLTPATRETDFGTLNNALRFTVYFDGQEVNGFNTIFNAVAFTRHREYAHWTTRIICSSFNTYETETFDVQGQYYIDQLEADFGKPTFGQVAFNRGVGTFLNHARNYLDAWVNSGEVQMIYRDSNFVYDFGFRYQNEYIKDELSEWNYVDSSGYSLPYLPYNSLDLQDVVKTHAKFYSNRYMGHAQVSWRKTLRDTSDFTATLGVRANYWDMNGQLIVSPRLQLTWEPHWTTTVQFRLSGGLYQQPPFYKELRDFAGNVNKQIKAQTSVHVIAGSTVAFMAWERPFVFVGEVYYKYLDNLIPYEVNDVRIRYYGQNLARGYAYGLDLRLNGEFVEGVDSWVNLSLLRTREDLYNDDYYLFLNSDGDTIVPGFTFNNIPTDSILQSPGMIPRPTDQLLTFSIYFQDYIPKHEEFKMNLGLVLGSGLPFGPPTHQRYQAIFRMPPYRRVDIGFSYALVKPGQKLKPSSPFRFMHAAWISAEVYNLLQVQNTLSYYWLKDVTGRTYAVPNYLTNRQLSVRMVIDF